MFEGIGDDEVIGDFGFVLGGAAGDEIDRFDLDLGSPAHGLVLATSAGQHTDYYQVTAEDVPIMVPGSRRHDQSEGARGHGLLRDAEWRRRVLGRLDQLAGQPGLERL